MTNIYIVEGRTGQYEDKSSWIVGAFKDKNKATTFADDCNKEAQRIEKFLHKHDMQPCQIYCIEDEKLEKEAKHKYDSDFQMDTNGTRYRMYSVEMKK